MDTLEKLAALMATKEFADKVDRMDSPEELHAFLLAHGVDMPFAQVAEIMRCVSEAQLPATDELSDASMEDVAGGMAEAAVWRIFKRSMQKLGSQFDVAADPRGRLRIHPRAGATAGSGRRA